MNELGEWIVVLALLAVVIVIVSLIMNGLGFQGDPDYVCTSWETYQGAKGC